MKHRRAAVGLFACWMGATAWSADKDAPLAMEPVRVSAIWSNAVIRVVYLRSSDGPRISFLRVESVRDGSAAARAGLAKGMEIVALQGVTLSGLTEEEYDKVMRAPAKEAFVLRVRREGRVRTEEIRIAVGK